jgi:p-cumate 2,3-dioxygenase beta subunit
MPDNASGGTAEDLVRQSLDAYLSSRFLYREARLLDEWRLDEWLSLFDTDGRYVVPATDYARGDARRDVVFIDDDYERLRARVERLKSRFAHAEFPTSRTRHIVSNIEIERSDQKGVHVRSSFQVVRYREGTKSVYVGQYEHSLFRRDEGDFRIALRKATLDQETLNEHGAISIIV